MTTLVGDQAEQRTLVGYCWPWTVRGGESIDFMVSSDHARLYNAELVRLICADDLSDAGVFKVVPTGAAFAGQYAGRFQPTYPGSYVEIEAHPVMNELRSISVQLLAFPTHIPGGTRIRGGGDPNSWDQARVLDQYLVSRWNEGAGEGWALLIDQQGRVAFQVGDGIKRTRVRLDRPLMQDRWFLILASMDLEAGIVRLAARAVSRGPGSCAAWPDVETQKSVPFRQVPQKGALSFAGRLHRDGVLKHSFATQVFNGRLDRVRLTRSPRTLNDAYFLSIAETPESKTSDIVGFWDFSRDIQRVEITDLSLNELHGRTVNSPLRAVASFDWNGTTADWRVSPKHFSAIHFHDDDLYDAQWDVDFTYRVPYGLPSGIYAARLTQGRSVDYIPFFVAPPKGKATAKVALLLPTITYTAYTNITGLTAFKRPVQRRDLDGELRIDQEDIHPCILQRAADAKYVLENYRRLGKGIYSNHSDGTLSSNASQRHPNMTTKPGGVNWTLVADTYITHWLSNLEVECDIITDELLHHEGVGLLRLYPVVLTGNHPEYCTRKILDAIEDYQRAGGRLMYLGGNGFYWVTSLHPLLSGLIEVRKDTYAGHLPVYERRHAFDGEMGGKWATNGRSPAQLVGSTYDFDHGYAMECGAAYQRLPDSRLPRAAFIFDGVESDPIGDFGVYGKGAAGQEVDTIDPEGGAPAHALHLARASQFARYGSLLAPEYQVSNHGPIADLIFFETPNGGAVFSVGSMSWVGSLSHNHFNNDVARITQNVLRRFLDPTPFAPAVRCAARRVSKGVSK